MNAHALPVAGTPQVRSAIRALAGNHRRTLTVVVSLHAAAALAGLVAPRLLGEIVEAVKAGTSTGHVDVLAAVIASALVLQTVLSRFAAYRSSVLGEEVLAELLEEVSGRHTVAGRRLGRKDATAAGAAGATVALLGAAAVVRRARKARRRI